MFKKNWVSSVGLYLIFCAYCFQAMRAKKENGWANRPRNQKRHEDGLQNQLRRLLNKPNHLHQNLLNLFNRNNLLLTMTMMTCPRVQGSGLRRSRRRYRLLRKRVARREGRVVSRNGSSRRENGTRRCSRTRREKMRKRMMMMMIGILKGDEVCYVYLWDARVPSSLKITSLCVWKCISSLHFKVWKHRV